MLLVSNHSTLTRRNRCKNNLFWNFVRVVVRARVIRWFKPWWYGPLENRSGTFASQRVVSSADMVKSFDEGACEYIRINETNGGGWGKNVSEEIWEQNSYNLAIR